MTLPLIIALSPVASPQSLGARRSSPWHGRDRQPRRARHELPRAVQPWRTVCRGAVAVGNEWAHAWLGEYERFTVMGLAALQHRTSRDASQCHRASAEHGPRTRADLQKIQLRGHQTPRLVEPAEQQTGATQRLVHPATMAEEASPPDAREIAGLLGANAVPRSPCRAAPKSMRWGQPTKAVRGRYSRSGLPQSVLKQQCLAQSPLRIWNVAAPR